MRSLKRLKVGLEADVKGARKSLAHVSEAGVDIVPKICELRQGLLWCIVTHCNEPVEDMNAAMISNLIHLPNCRLLIVLLLPLLELLLPLFLVNLTKEISDAQVALFPCMVVVLIAVLAELRGLNMNQHPVDLFKVAVLLVGGEAIITWELYLVVAATARCVAWLAGDDAIVCTSLVFIPMWVVNTPRLYATGAPVKGGVTLDTPHLRAPIDFVNWCCTLGAGPCVLQKEFHGSNLVGVACVLLSLYFGLEALVAHTNITQSAPVLRCQETVACVNRTMLDECTFLRTPLIFSALRVACLNPALEEPNPVANGGVLVAQFSDTLHSLTELRGNTFLFVSGFAALTLQCSEVLCVREHCFFDAEEDILSLLLQLTVTKVFGEVGLDELAIPGVLTIHTRWIINIKNIFFPTISTDRLVAGCTSHPHSGRIIEIIAANLAK